MTTKDLDYETFLAVDMRVGRILSVEPNAKARKPSYCLKVDFGPEIGVKASSAQIVDLYDEKDLRGRRVVAVVNFPPKRIAGFLSEVLVMGAPDAEGRVALLSVDGDVPLGARIF
jgi:tRNA-binding protein